MQYNSSNCNISFAIVVRVFQLQSLIMTIQFMSGTLVQHRRKIRSLVLTISNLGIKRSVRFFAISLCIREQFFQNAFSISSPGNFPQNHETVLHSRFASSLRFPYCTLPFALKVSVQHSKLQTQSTVSLLHEPPPEQRSSSSRRPFKSVSLDTLSFKIHVSKRYVSQGKVSSSWQSRQGLFAARPQSFSQSQISFPILVIKYPGSLARNHVRQWIYFFLLFHRTNFYKERDRERANPRERQAVLSSFLFFFHRLPYGRLRHLPLINKTQPPTNI